MILVHDHFQSVREGLTGDNGVVSWKGIGSSSRHRLSCLLCGTGRYEEQQREGGRDPSALVTCFLGKRCQVRGFGNTPTRFLKTYFTYRIRRLEKSTFPVSAWNAVSVLRNRSGPAIPEKGRGQ